MIAYSVQKAHSMAAQNNGLNGQTNGSGFMAGYPDTQVKRIFARSLRTAAKRASTRVRTSERSARRTNSLDSCSTEARSPQAHVDSVNALIMPSNWLLWAAS